MNPWLREPFFQFPQTTQTTCQGDVDFPILYFDTSCLMAFFLAPLVAVEEILSGKGLKPALVIGDKVLVGVAFYQYRQTSIGSYNEAGVAIPVVPDCYGSVFSNWLDLFSSVQNRRVGFHIIDLPVTTDAACAAGREAWGYPKFVADIPFDLRGRQFSASVVEKEFGKTIVSLEGQTGFGVPMLPMDLLLYSFLDKQCLRTAVNIRGTVTIASGNSLRLRLGDADHVMTDNIRSLSLDGQKPKFVSYTHGFQSRLNLGALITG